MNKIFSFKAIQDLILKSTFKRDNLFEVPEVKKDDVSDYSSDESHSSSSSEEKKEDQVEENEKTHTTTSSQDSEEDEEDTMKPGYLSDENESNAKNIRRNT